MGINLWKNENDNWTEGKEECRIMICLAGELQECCYDLQKVTGKMLWEVQLGRVFWTSGFLTFGVQSSLQGWLV